MHSQITLEHIVRNKVIFVGDSQSQQENGSDVFSERNPMLLSSFLRIKGISLLNNKSVLKLGISDSVNDSSKSKNGISPHYFQSPCQTSKDVLPVGGQYSKYYLQNTTIWYNIQYGVTITALVQLAILFLIQARITLLFLATYTH